MMKTTKRRNPLIYSFHRAIEANEIRPHQLLNKHTEEEKLILVLNLVLHQVSEKHRRTKNV
jgi:hypothetical protein